MEYERIEKVIVKKKQLFTKEEKKIKTTFKKLDTVFRWLEDNRLWPD